MATLLIDHTRPRYRFDVAESAEHAFLSRAVTSYLERAANTRLYTFLENQRRTFDFGCTLLRDWTRPIVGQTLWKHEEGVDKDLRTLLADAEAEICIYIARDTVRARAICAEATADFRKNFRDARVQRLRTLWVPADFDADAEEHRERVRAVVEDSLATDVLLNVILGNLNRESIRLFLSSTGRISLDLTILHRIATLGFRNLRPLASDLGISSSSLPERLVRLVGCGLLIQPAPNATYFHASLRGRVFLELCREVAGGAGNPELDRILLLLGLVDELGVSVRPGGLEDLHIRISAAREEYGVELTVLNYERYWESEAWPPTIPRPDGFR